MDVRYPAYCVADKRFYGLPDRLRPEDGMVAFCDVLGVCRPPRTMPWRSCGGWRSSAPQFPAGPRVHVFMRTTWESLGIEEVGRS
jgi:hypothetical protein